VEWVDSSSPWVKLVDSNPPLVELVDSSLCSEEIQSALGRTGRLQSTCGGMGQLQLSLGVVDSSLRLEELFEPGVELVVYSVHLGFVDSVHLGKNWSTQSAVLGGTRRLQFALTGSGRMGGHDLHKTFSAIGRSWNRHHSSGHSGPRGRIDYVTDDYVIIRPLEQVALRHGDQRTMCFCLP
jgi:hypothetical protein